MITFLLAACSSSAPVADAWFSSIGQGIPTEADEVCFALAESGTHIDVWVVVDEQWAFRSGEEEIPPLATPRSVLESNGNDQVRAAGEWLATRITAADAAALLGAHESLRVRVVDEGTAWTGWSGTLTRAGLNGRPTQPIGQ